MKRVRCSRCGCKMDFYNGRFFCPQCETQDYSHDVHDFRLFFYRIPFFVRLIIRYSVFFGILCFFGFMFFPKKKVNNCDFFNNQFVYDGGVRSSSYVGSILDKIISSDRAIVLEYGGRNITDFNEIFSIKSSLNGDYEVFLRYDDEGCVNRIILDKVD